VDTGVREKQDNRERKRSDRMSSTRIEIGINYYSKLTILM
jgi:hypothetical protein